MGTYATYFYTFSLFVCLLCSGCALQNSHSEFTLHDQVIPLFVEMPQNSLVFENITPLFYENIHRHLLRVGYKLINSPSQAYTLRISITKLSPLNKFVSSQLSLLHQQMTLEVECTLLDFDRKEVAKKRFTYSRLLSKAQDPGMTNSFEDFVYSQLCQKLSIRIESFFRPFLLKAFEKKQ